MCRRNAQIDRIDAAPALDCQAISVKARQHVGARIAHQDHAADAKILQDLRADALRVAASREVNQNGQWVAAPTRAATVQKLEGIILTKARDLRRSAIAD